MAAAVPLLWAAFRGGAYDIVPRQELALVVWWVIGVGAVTGLFPRARPTRSVLIPLLGLALLLVLTFVSLHWTASQEATTAELARVALYAGVVVLIVGLVERDTWLTVAAALTATAVVVAMASTLSRLAPGIADHTVERVLHTTRLSFPMNYWNAVGAWSAIAVAMTLLWSAHAARLWVRLIALACAPTCAIAVYLTYSRASIIDLVLGVGLALIFGRNRWTTLAHAAVAGAATAAVVLVVRGEPAIADATGSAGAGAVAAMLALAAAVCAVAVWLTWRAGADSRWRLGRRAARAALAAGAAAVCVVLVVLVATGVTGRAWTQFRTPAPDRFQTDPSARLANLNSLRYELWKSGADAWSAHPLDGIGPGTYDLWWSQHGTSSLTVRDAHSLYLENLAELGVGGLVAVLLFAGGLLAAAIRARPTSRPPPEIGAHAALCVGAVIFFLHAGIDWLWESTAVGLLGVACAATAAAARSEPMVRRPALGLRMPVVVLAVLLCLLELPGLAATLHERDATRAIDRGDAAGALRLANDAVAAEPWAASTFALRAQLLQRAGRVDAARVDLRRAIKAEPANWRHWFLLARLETSAGRSDAALAALAQARRLDPRSPIFR